MTDISFRVSVPRGQLVTELWPTATRAEGEVVPHGTTRRPRGAQCLSSGGQAAHCLPSCNQGSQWP